jgi:hypothetical protein
MIDFAFNSTTQSAQKVVFTILINSNLTPFPEKCIRFFYFTSSCVEEQQGKAKNGELKWSRKKHLKEFLLDFSVALMYLTRVVLLTLRSRHLLGEK